MDTVVENNTTPIEQLSPKDTDTEDTKLNKLDQLLNKTNAYSAFMNDKFKSSKTYGVVSSTTTSPSNSPPATTKEGSKGGRSRKRKADADTKSLQQKVDEVSSSDVQTLAVQPKLIVGGNLREYQLTGVNWMIGLWENGMNGILADEMGLGKTIQVISFLSHLWEKGVKGPFLIVAPLSTLPNWEKEFKKWCPSIPVTVYHDTKALRGIQRDKLDSAAAKRRKLATSATNDANAANGKGKGKVTKNNSSGNFVDEGVLPVIITSYDIAINDRKYLQKYRWKYLVVDEAHRLKNFECKLILELKQLHTDNRLLLTGTPLQNNLTELWSLLNFILPDIFDSVTNFQKWFDFTEVLEAKGQEDAVKDKRTHQSLIKKLHDILRPFLLRRLKTDVELSLPQKREIVVFCNQTQPQKSLYNAVRTKDLTAKKQGLANILMHLRKVCNHPFLFDVEVTKHYLDTSAETQQEIEDSKSAEQEKIDIDAPRKLRNRKEVKYSDEYDEYEFDRIIDELEAQSSDDEAEVEAEEKTKAVTTTTSPDKPKRARSGYHLFVRDQYAKLRDKGVAAQNLGDTARLIGKKWASLSPEEKEKYQRQLEEQMELLDNIIDPYKDDDPVKYKKALLSACGKLGLLDRMLPLLKAGGHKVLIFSQMTRLLDILEDYLELYNFKYCRIDGGVNRKEREAQIDAFNNDKEVFIFLLSTRAGGVGINLAAADTVIIYDSDWNPQMDLQAQDRCHRIGQTRPVVVYRLITAGSVEEHILARAKSKLRLENLVITKGQFNVDKELKQKEEEDIADILRMDQEDYAVGKKGELSDKKLQLIMDRKRCFDVEGENEGFEVLEEMIRDW